MIDVPEAITRVLLKKTTAGSRRAFVASCVDLLLKGNWSNDSNDNDAGDLTAAPTAPSRLPVPGTVHTVPGT